MKQYTINKHKSFRYPSIRIETLLHTNINKNNSHNIKIHTIKEEIKIVDNHTVNRRNKKEKKRNLNHLNRT